MHFAISFSISENSGACFVCVFFISSEILRYSVNETVVDDIDGLFTANDIRAFAGLSIYF